MRKIASIGQYLTGSTLVIAAAALALISISIPALAYELEPIVRIIGHLIGQ